MMGKTKKITVTGMLCALAYIAVAVGRIPLILFLEYDPKDVVITTGGFLLGPLESVIISVIVSLVEMVTISEDGVLGCMMNIVSSCSFACTASQIYKRKRTFAGAATGVAVGWLVMAGVMLLWNYCIAPIYMGYPREAVATLLLPAFLPFNLIKGGLNAAITLLLYKPVWAAFSRSKLIEEHETEERTKKASVGILLFTGAIFLSSVILALALSGII